MVPIASILAGLAPELFKIVDKTLLDKDQAVELKAAMAAQLMNNDSELIKASSSIITAEAQGESWLQRNWRPGLMVWFAILIGAYWFGFVPANMPEAIIADLFQLVQIGVGGYVVGRSGEKIASTLGPFLGKN